MTYDPWLTAAGFGNDLVSLILGIGKIQAFSKQRETPFEKYSCLLFVSRQMLFVNVNMIIFIL